MRQQSNATVVTKCFVVSAAAMIALGVALSAAPAYAQSSEPADGGSAALFADFLHFARLGKFTEASAHAEKLLASPDLDPITMLHIADEDTESIATLVTLIRHTSLADPAQRILDLIRDGEFQQRQQADRIADNIQKLGGPPQMEFNAIQRLKESGEYAVPKLVAALENSSRSQLWPRIIRTIPQIGKPAVGPLVVALRTDNADVQRDLIGALGEIGYAQAVPYLMQLLLDQDLTDGSRQAAQDAIQRLQGASRRTESADAAAGFVALADQYYREHGSVKADPRVSTANVWYWENDGLQAIKVPTEIFGPVMAMRACEEALKIEPGNSHALALWLASNIRREARLGMDVESGEPDAGADADATRSETFPRSIYFSRAAGPEYCHAVLGRAIRDGDKQVALGAIAALDVVAGAHSLVGPEDHKQPLVAALKFPDAEVRIKAAIALTRATPKTHFVGADIVGHVLAEALGQGNRIQYVVVCRDTDNLNRVAAELRAQGADVVAETDFYAAMQRARRELASIAGFVLASDIDNPAAANALAELRSEFRFARTPIVILAKPGQEHRVEFALSGAESAAQTDFDADGEEIQGAFDTLAQADGSGPMDDSLSDALALRAAKALQLLARDGRSVIDPSATVPALVDAIDSDDPELQVAAAQALALLPSSEGQQATCNLATATNAAAEQRVAAFDALAESAKRQGNRLTADQIAAIVQIAKDEADLAMRTAASQALGALNLQQGEASDIVRSYHRG